MTKREIKIVVAAVVIFIAIILFAGVFKCNRTPSSGNMQGVQAYDTALKILNDRLKSLEEMLPAFDQRDAKLSAEISEVKSKLYNNAKSFNDVIRRVNSISSKDSLRAAVRNITGQ